MKFRKPFLPNQLLGATFGKIACAAVMMLGLLLPGNADAQCIAGYNQVTLNWDALDYFSYTSTGNYVTNNYLTNISQAQNQYFAFGTQRLTVTNNYAAANNLGEDVTHTGDAGSYGVGHADVHFLGNGQVTLTFENEVRNLKFSLYDVDRAQAVSFNATNALGVAQSVSLTRLGTSILTLFLNNTALANATAAGSTNVANNLPDASLNVDIAGPVKTVTINITGTTTNGSEDGSFWLSNITACSAGSLPNNYYNVSKPFTGQPGYVLHAFDRSVYAVNPATGKTRFLFTDNTTPFGAITASNRCYVNSMAYDPYRRILYYVYSLTTSASTNRMLRKYDFNTNTISTVLADLSSVTYGTGVGIPITNVSGVESGAAAFYNGALYLGIETSNSNRKSGRESIIWRIDFDGANVPYRACQAFGIPVDSGDPLVVVGSGTGTLLHDWSDFIINDGVLYDFDGAGVTTETDVFQMDMITGDTTDFSTPAGWTPGQPTVDWSGNLYQLYATTVAPVVSPYIALYNPTNGTIGTNLPLTSTPAYTPAIPSLGDAGEAFRPFLDFGDAPASYDPVTGDPAVHDTLATLRLGASESIEWLTRGQSAPATDDNAEDALGAAPPVLNFGGTITYTVNNISVFNNTGANATLVAWLDYNLNGKFDVGEGRSVTVGTSASAQLINISWTGIYIPATAATGTYLRLRLTRAANGMTTSNMNGYFPDGEVEDYRVIMGSNLPVEITAFDVQKGNAKTANLSWATSGDMTGNAAFEIERSTDGQQWQKVGTVSTAVLQANADHFNFRDENALSGKSYYRIKIIGKDGSIKYTEVKTIYFSSLTDKISVSPNPVTDYINIRFTTGQATVVKIALHDHNGKTIYEKKVNAVAGENTVRLSDLKIMASGMYYLNLGIGEEIFSEKLVVNRN